MICEFDLLFTL